MLSCAWLPIMGLWLCLVTSGCGHRLDACGGAVPDPRGEYHVFEVNQISEDAAPLSPHDIGSGVVDFQDGVVVVTVELKSGLVYTAIYDVIDSERPK